jgi:hypothetical protein
MNRAAATAFLQPPLRRGVTRTAALSLLWLLTALPASSGPVAEAQEALGIAVFPGAELIALEGPSPELVDLQRPGWEFVVAEVTVADFLVEAPMAELRRFYHELCTRDPELLLVRKVGPAHEIVSVRHAGRHPLHARKRWLRITAYRLPGPHLEGE